MQTILLYADIVLSAILAFVAYREHVKGRRYLDALNHEALENEELRDTIARLRRRLSEKPDINVSTSGYKRAESTSNRLVQRDDAPPSTFVASAPLAPIADSSWVFPPPAPVQASFTSGGGGDFGGGGASATWDAPAPSPAPEPPAPAPSYSSSDSCSSSSSSYDSSSSSSDSSCSSSSFD